MKTLILMTMLVFSATVQAEELVIVDTPNGERLELKQDAYGSGQHMDQYGRRIQMQGNGASADSRIERRDAYAPGVHMDQYGNAVSAAPADQMQNNRQNKKRQW